MPKPSTSTSHSGVSPVTPLGRLICERLSVLGIDAEALGRRLGYTNPAKAAGRVHALSVGFVDSPASLRALKRLASALEVDEGRVSTAVEETRALVRSVAEKEAAAIAAERRKLREEEEMSYRRDFVPHVVLQTEQSRPSPIVACMMTGGPERWLVLRLDARQPPETFLEQAFKLMDKQLRRTPDGEFTTPFFGRVVGLYINLSPDDALRYDLDGRLLEHRPRAVRFPSGSVSVGRQQLPQHFLGSRVTRSRAR